MEKETKKNLGQYFTKQNSWLQPQVKRFITLANKSIIVDPFAGDGDIFKALEHTNKKFVGFDIDPSLNWELNDGLLNVPKIDDAIIITNPPYLAKNSANKNKLTGFSYFNNNDFQDLYQIAIQKVLSVYDYSVFIIPETFINSGLFKEHIDNITIIEEALFDDTTCPVCVCCFHKFKRFLNNSPFDFYKNDLFLFDSNEINERICRLDFLENVINISFNIVDGNLGLRGVDGTNPTDRIRFCLPEDLNYDTSKIKISSRAITLIKIDYPIDALFIEKINGLLEEYRCKTHDVFLSPFKNNNKKGKRRRRLDFNLAKKLINTTVRELKNNK